MVEASKKNTYMVSGPLQSSILSWDNSEDY